MENRKPTPSEFAGGLVWNVLLENLRMEIVGRHSLLLANNHLKRGGRILINHNHPGTTDPVYVLRTVFAELDYKSLGYPASSKFFDRRMAVFGWVIDNLKLKGKMDEAWPIMQDDDKEKDEVKIRQILARGARQLKSMSRQEAKDLLHRFHDFVLGSEDQKDKLTDGSINTQPSGTLNEEMLEEAIVFFRDAPSPVMPIGQEGTRNIQEKLFIKNRGLKKPKNGAAFIFGSVPDNTLLLPIAIEGSENVHQKGQKTPPNLLARTRVHIGIPRTFGEIVKVAEYLNPHSYVRSVSDAMMLELAVELPPAYWGVYAEMVEGIMKNTKINDPRWALEWIRNNPVSEVKLEEYQQFFITVNQQRQKRLLKFSHTVNQR